MHNFDLDVPMKPMQFDWNLLEALIYICLSCISMDLRCLRQSMTSCDITHEWSNRHFEVAT